jgi:hypothetical protein
VNEQAQPLQIPASGAPVRVLLVDQAGVPIESVGQSRSIFIDAALGVISGIVVGYFIRRFAVRGDK